MALSFCSLASGSSGNCQLVASEQTKILVDAGMSGKYIKGSLEHIGISIEDIDGILLTHEHADHISGLGVLMRRYKMPLFVTEKTWDAVKSKIGNIDPNLLRLYPHIDDLAIGDIMVQSARISHDAVDPLCYAFINDGTKIGIATDLGTISDEVVAKFKDCDLLMIESNHDIEMLKTGNYPMVLKRRILSEFGHLSNDDAGYIAREIIGFGKTKHILLAHLSKENNFPDLAYETVRGILEEGSIEVGKDIILDMTYRDRVSKLYKINK
ncbi:MBL fold metallo-hydrolase [Fusibacter tunisiensis]|uniref:Phosphoribosyl 1,2-cyclic phosphodiesterase n=1 Tax=Fusibacter tunisiensis TaxID=1008308 RepID=A0ABS2MPB4_9FIRM|nr:MBL fold metallo-hydrolase [Fusibacter tunisiensis]MBM7561247.1 phosphoribosyl 1,2-cyclic phosphodiesterase [Fusibacter tunisiensis]